MRQFTQASFPPWAVDTLKNVGLIGMTFGGGCFAGHGVYLNSGNATFTVTDFRIIP